MPKKILVVDDDPAMREILDITLTREGYKVAIASGGKEGLQKAYDERPDLVLLDIMMPDMDGWQVCRRLRETTDVPIIMFTVLGKAEQTVKGLRVGANDYIVKPWSNRELLARIHAQLRRAATFPTSYGDLVIDPIQREVALRDKKIHLTPTEFRLLAYLARRRGQVVPYSELIAQIWGMGVEQDIDALRWHVYNLRKKIETDPRNPRYLLARHGIGYYFAGQHRRSPLDSRESE